MQPAGVAAAPSSDPGAAAAVAPGGSAGLAAVLRSRLEQIERWGHTPESDRAQPMPAFLNHMLHEIHAYATAAADDHRARAGLPQIAKRLARIGALAIATLDRIEGEGGEQ